MGVPRSAYRRYGWKSREDWTAWRDSFLAKSDRSTGNRGRDLSRYSDFSDYEYVQRAITSLKRQRPDLAPQTLFSRVLGYNTESAALIRRAQKEEWNMLDRLGRPDPTKAHCEFLRMWKIYPDKTEYRYCLYSKAEIGALEAAGLKTGDIDYGETF